MSAALHSRLQSGAVVHESDEWMASIIDVALQQLVYTDGSVTGSIKLLHDYLAWCAKKGYDRGRLDAMMSLMTTDEVAAQLGVDHSTVVRRAQRKGVGWKMGRDYLFWPEDVERLRLVG